jgi:hypothetical protein
VLLDNVENSNIADEKNCVEVTVLALADVTKFVLNTIVERETAWFNTSKSAKNPVLFQQEVMCLINDITSLIQKNPALQNVQQMQQLAISQMCT